MNKDLQVKYVAINGRDRIVQTSVYGTGVEVFLNDSCQDELFERRILLNWEQMEDVELLSTVFEMETVKVFKVLVTMLGKVHADRQAEMRFYDFQNFRGVIG